MGKRIFFFFSVVKIPPRGVPCQSVPPAGNFTEAIWPSEREGHEKRPQRSRRHIQQGLKGERDWPPPPPPLRLLSVFRRHKGRKRTMSRTLIVAAAVIGFVAAAAGTVRGFEIGTEERRRNSGRRNHRSLSFRASCQINLHKSRFFGFITTEK